MEVKEEGRGSSRACACARCSRKEWWPGRRDEMQVGTWPAEAEADVCALRSTHPRFGSDAHTCDARVRRHGRLLALHRVTRVDLGLCATIYTARGTATDSQVWIPAMLISPPLKCGPADSWVQLSVMSDRRRASVLWQGGLVRWRGWEAHLVGCHYSMDLLYYSPPAFFSPPFIFLINPFY
jgi:hypothetical protein